MRNPGRDPEKGNNDPLMSAPRGKDGKTFPVHVIWGFVNIPLAEARITSLRQEVEWVEENCQVCLQTLKQEVRKPVFQAAIAEAYTERMFKAMMKPSEYGPSFNQFFQSCRAQIEKADNLNKYVILDEVKTIQLFLIKNELEEKKYFDDAVDADPAIHPKTETKAVKSNSKKRAKKNKQSVAPTASAMKKPKKAKEVTPQKMDVAAEILTQDDDDATVSEDENEEMTAAFVVQAEEVA